MTYFKTITFIAAAVLSIHTVAQEPTAKLGKYREWGDRDLAFNSQAQLTCDKNFYNLNLLQSKPNKKGQTKTVFHLSAPRQQWNFGRAPINFLSMRVNGISLSSLEPQAEHVTTWKKGDRAGVRYVLNFDGAKIFMDAAVKKGSPLLFLTFSQPEKQLEPIQKPVQINFSAVVSRLLTRKGVTIWDGVYSRQAQSAARLITQQKAPVKLTPADKYLVLSDTILDGTGKGDAKGIGPCLIAFDLKDGMTGTLKMPNSWITHIEFQLPPNFKEFKSAVFMQKNIICNAEFMKRFNAEKTAFTSLD
ncbi:MAG: hypothetical protein IKB16_16470 [Lentisphaeria bacterium]|nr:hypothetical protein [Lentisphaeria bacterium]